MKAQARAAHFCLLGIPDPRSRGSHDNR
jgi:hypothetical protein